MDEMKSKIHNMTDKEEFSLEEVYLEETLTDQDAIWLAQRRRWRNRNN